MEIFLNILNIAFKILIALLVFGFIIFIHELGHFVAARWAKVKVNEFAIGMGPRIFKFQGKETLYSLRLFPIGGFCAMEGEDDESDDQNAFHKKSVFKRIIIIISGALMNIIFGFIIMTGITGTQDLIGINKIAQFKEDSISNTGENRLMVNDSILKINGSNIYVQYDIIFNLIRDQDGVIDFTVERDGNVVDLKGVKFNIVEEKDIKSVYIDFFCYGTENNFGLTLKESAMNTISVVKQVWVSFFDLITGNIPLSQLSGPVGVTEAIGSSVSWSWDLTPLFRIISLITINIGIFNLLPLPALDGGRLVFLIIEAIRRKPIPQKYEGMVHFIGLALLIILIIFVSFNDITRLFQK
ncbi:MAG: site-2 protease family protein [Oscillospiraceae bacterium]